tara:strand:+ start:4001 stop:5125 length:1125 start_codon:yes stop_codon:yes gene_type:complete
MMSLRTFYWKINKMKKTILNEIHKELGAKMGEFAGYEMPIQYAGVKHEHLNVRNNVGVFDVSHMGEFVVSGPNAEKLLQKICSNDIQKIKVGQAQYNCLPNEKGGVIDDLIIYRTKKEEYLLVVNASNIKKDWNWIIKWNLIYNAEINDISDETCLIAIQGPNAMKLVKKLSKIDSLPYYTSINSTFADVSNTLIASTGYTGSGGVEIYCKEKNAIKIWNSIIDAGKYINIMPVGLAARDTLRIEMGYCLYGNEINDKISPIMARLNWITKTNKNSIGSKKFKFEITNGTNKKLIGLKLIEKGIPRSGYRIFNTRGTVIGFITSGTHSPSLEIGIGLGYVDSNYSSVGTYVYVEIRNKKIKGQISKLPFINTQF